MMFYIWIGAVICLTVYFKGNMARNDKKHIAETTYVDEVVVDGKEKKIIKDKCPNCGNGKLHYKGARKTAVYEYKFAVCNECGTSFRVRHEPSSANGCFAFLFSFVICTIGAMVVGMLMILT